MNSLRSEALLDVILAATAILLIFLLILKPVTVEQNHYRQASLALGCFSGPDGAPWDKDFVVYQRKAGPGAGDEDWQVVQESVGINSLRRILRDILGKDTTPLRLALLVDFSGARCAVADNRYGKKVFQTLRDLKKVDANLTRAVSHEIIPCRDRAQCEALFQLPARGTAS